MEITVILFGQLTELTGTSTLRMEQVADTDELIQQLQEKFPSFASAAYIVAVDKNVITENTPLSPGITVALLPPFSGG